jgi:hypothetical protein
MVFSSSIAVLFDLYEQTSAVAALTAHVGATMAHVAWCRASGHSAAEGPLSAIGVRPPGRRLHKRASKRQLSTRLLGTTSRRLASTTPRSCFG